MGNKPPPKSGGAPKKPGGGFWGFLEGIFSNVSVDVNVGRPGRGRAAAGNAADPATRMEPVREDRQETYEEMIYRKTEGADGTAPAVRVDRDRKIIARSLEGRTAEKKEAAVPQGGGAPLSRDVRRKMEPRLGADLSDVRVHTSGESAAAAEGLNAKAFTVGNDVHFGSGNFAPGSKDGDRLLAHELTHVVQGSRSGVQRKADDGEHEAGGGEAGVSHPDEPAEKEADSVADKVAGDLHEGAGAEGDAKADGAGGDAKHGQDKKQSDKGSKGADAKGGGAEHASQGGGKHGAGEEKKSASGGEGAPKSGDAKSGGGDSAAKGGEKKENSANAGADNKKTDGGDAKVDAGKQQAPKIAAKHIGPLPITATLGASVGRKIFRATNPPANAAPAAKPPAGAGGAQQPPAADPNQVAFQRRTGTAGASDKVEIRPSAPSGDGPAELMVGNQKGDARLQRILAGPMIGSTNKAGNTLVEGAAKTIAAAAGAVSQLQIKGGKVDKTKQDALASQFDAAVAAADSVVKGLKVTALEQAEHLTPMKNKQTANFNKPDPTKWKKPYVNKFIGEMVKQLQAQETGMNELSIDKWAINVNQYAPTQHLNEMHESARQVVLDELKARVQDALPKAQKRLAELQAKKTKLDAEKAKLEAATGAKPADMKKMLEDLVKTDEKLAEVIGDIAGLSTAGPEIDRGQGGAKDLDPKKMKPAGGRDGNEGAWAAKHKAAKEELVKRVLKMDGTIAEWEGIVKSTGDLAVLHNPDQICGGEGDIEAFPVVKEPTGADDTADNRKEWEAYLERVKSHFGVLDINSSLGSQWKTEIGTLYTNVTSDPDNPQAAYAIRKLNVHLKPV